MRARRFGDPFLFLPCLLLLTVCLSIIMILPPGAVALDVTLIWGPNSEPDLAGYRLYLRRDGEFFDYDHPEWEGPEPTCTVRDLDEDTHYYFVVRAFDTAGNESGDSNELGLPVLLLSPFEGSDPADAPTFQWTPGPCDLYMFCTLFSYPEVGYYPACVLTEDDFLVMPPAWWNRIEEGPLCYWDVHGFNTKTGHYESPHYTEFTKIE